MAKVRKTFLQMLTRCYNIWCTELICNTAVSDLLTSPVYYILPVCELMVLSVVPFASITYYKGAFTRALLSY